jgi:hypothetical protein
MDFFSLHLYQKSRTRYAVLVRFSMREASFFTSMPESLPLFLLSLYSLLSIYIAYFSLFACFTDTIIDIVKKRAEITCGGKSKQISSAFPPGIPLLL